MVGLEGRGIVGCGDGEVWWGVEMGVWSGIVVGYLVEVGDLCGEFDVR